MTPRESESKVDEYTYYMIVGVGIVLVAVVLGLALHFLVGLLLALSMGA